MQHAKLLVLAAAVCRVCRASASLGRQPGASSAAPQDNDDDDARGPPKPSAYSFASYQRGASTTYAQQQPLPQQQQQYQHYQQQQYQQQQQQQQHQHPLLKQAGSASIGALFALLIWRSLSAYELADQLSSGTLRVLAVTPTIVILCANLAGFVVNMFRPVNFKNHLKAILVANICREVAELVYNMIMVLFTSSQSSVPREIFFGRFMMSTWWLFLCFSFAKSRWVSNASLQRSYSRTAPAPPPQQGQPF